MTEAASIAIETIVIPFSQFFPLIKDVGEILVKIMDLYNTAQHNKKLTKLLADRIAAANSAVSVLREDDLHTPQHYANLQRLVQVLQNMKKFSEDITQYSKLHKFLESKTIESKYNDLCKEYDSSVNLLNLTLMVDFKVNAERDREILKEEVREVAKFQAALVESMNDMNKKFDQMDEKLTKAMNYIVTQASEVSITMQSIENLGISELEAQKKIDNIFNETPLPIDDYEETETSRGENGKLRKYTHVKTLEEYAFKLIEGIQINQVKNQVTILKKIKECQNVIHFYGITKDSGDAYHLVTEWAEHGNLSEYIKEHGQNIKIELRLRFAYDIAKGLNFLNAAKIVHRDIKSENIVITQYDIAKITNFKLSRGFEGATGNLAVTKESVRHNAPEMLRRGLSGTGGGTDKDKKKKYDTKCEVYSFGILLWEIAECKVAYSQFEDFMEITNKVINGYREQFTKDTDIPEKYQNLVTKSVDQNPSNRPTFAKILTNIQDIFRTYTSSDRPASRSNSMEQSTNRPSSIISERSSNRPPTPTRKDSLLVFSWDATMNISMTIDKAVEEHHNKSSTMDKKELYKCFDAYAKMGNPQAKYWKAYYITKGWSDLPSTSKKENLKIAAELYKEAADYGDEFPEAQLRYALMITQQKGPTDEAIEYLVKAAKNGHVVAMYNVATYYFSNKDEELGKRYMLMAANKKYPDAIKYCNDKNIPL